MTDDEVLSIINKFWGSKALSTDDILYFALSVPLTREHVNAELIGLGLEK